MNKKLVLAALNVAVLGMTAGLFMNVAMASTGEDPRSFEP
jgi:hypothetical protein